MTFHLTWLEGDAGVGHSDNIIHSNTTTMQQYYGHSVLMCSLGCSVVVCDCRCSVILSNDLLAWSAYSPNTAVFSRLCCNWICTTQHYTLETVQKTKKLKLRSL